MKHGRLFKLRCITGRRAVRTYCSKRLRVTSGLDAELAAERFLRGSDSAMPLTDRSSVDTSPMTTRATRRTVELGMIPSRRPLCALSTCGFTVESVRGACSRACRPTRRHRCERREAAPIPRSPLSECCESPRIGVCPMSSFLSSCLLGFLLLFSACGGCGGRAIVSSAASFATRVPVPRTII